MVGQTFGVLPWGHGFRDFGEQGGATSSCAPQVAGAMAILMTQYPEADNATLRAALRAGASNVALGQPPVPYTPATGSGVLQVRRSLEAVPWARFHPSYGMELLFTRRGG